MAEVEKTKLSVGDLSNSPREVAIGTRTLKIRQLSIKEMFGYFESKIKDQKIEDAKLMAAALDPGMRKEFIIEVWKNLPSGLELTDRVTDLMASIDGVYDVIYLASRDLNEIELNDVKDLIGFDNLPELTPIVNWIAGMSSSTVVAEEAEGDEGDEENTGKKK